MTADVPPTTGIHATDRLVEPRQPNKMRIVWKWPRRAEPLQTSVPAAKSNILGLNMIEYGAKGAFSSIKLLG